MKLFLFSLSNRNGQDGNIIPELCRRQGLASSLLFFLHPCHFMFAEFNMFQVVYTKKNAHFWKLCIEKSSHSLTGNTTLQPSSYLSSRVRLQEIQKWQWPMHYFHPRYSLQILHWFTVVLDHPTIANFFSQNKCQTTVNTIYKKLLCLYNLIWGR